MKNCLICKKLHKNKKLCSRKCRSIFSSILNKERKHTPPSRKGIPWKKESIEKRQKTRIERRSNIMKEETKIKIRSARKILFDKIGRKCGLVSLLKITPQYKNWRKKVFERDKYTCQECGVRSGRGKAVVLEADHIKPKSIFIKECEFDLQKCLQYKPLWDIKNGRTLCKDCHKRTPTYGGRSRVKECGLML